MAGKKLVCVLAVSSALAMACSKRSPSGGNAGSPGSGGSSGTTGTTATVAVTCSQLKAADVQGLMTNAVTGVETTAVGTDGHGQRCVFHDANDEAVTVVVIPASDPTLGYEAVKAATANAVSVPGVGDRAFRAPGDASPIAVHGGVVCTVSTSSAIQIPAVAKLVVNGKLDLSEAQNTVLATALGTVCNRVFGTGNTQPNLAGL